MDAAHKTILRDNRVRLVEDLELIYVFDGLVEKKIFAPVDYEDLQIEGKTKRGTNQKFLNALEKRGTNAFPAFVDALRKHSQNGLANLIDPGSAPSQPAAGDRRRDRLSSQPVDSGPEGDSKAAPMDIDDEKSVITSPSADTKWPGDNPALLINTHMEIGDQQSETDADTVYQMKSKPRGLAVIINNMHFHTMNVRKGTDIDGQNLNHVFQKLGFNTIIEEDQTAAQMAKIIERVSAHNHTSFDCFALAILSHGLEGGIYGVDERLIKIESITRHFEARQCPTLVGKPKLFFIQACRGERFDIGVEGTDSCIASAPVAGPSVQDSTRNLSDDQRVSAMFERELSLDAKDASNQLKSKLPSQSDMLLAYATVPGYVSWRNSERGSWFIQALTEVFLAHAMKEDLLSMMTMVNNKVAIAFESSSGRNKQMPAPVNLLRKKLFFNPGH